MSEHRKQSAGEELANTISHAVALLIGAAAVPFLIVIAVKKAGPAEVVGVVVFSCTMVLLSSTSAIYHMLSEGRMKQLFRLLDHSAIYLLIAGTYTPFTLSVFRGPLGWTMFGLVWGMALAGIVSKAAGAMKYARLSVVFYIVMGWLAVFVIKPLWMELPRWGFIWLVAGGLLYTLGIGFYAASHVRYAHFVWHLFVMAGTASHIVAVASIFA